jgi:hypothetical protein
LADARDRVLRIERLEELTKTTNQGDDLTKVIGFRRLRGVVRKLLAADVAMELGQFLAEASKFCAVNKHVLVALKHVHDVILERLDPLGVGRQNVRHPSQVILFGISQKFLRNGRDRPSQILTERTVVCLACRCNQT